MIHINNVSLFYDTVQGTVKAVENVSFTIYNGEIVGIAGESGCGKSTLMKGIYGNVERPMYLADGSIELELDDLGETEIIPNTEFHRYWWKYISYIPQASMSVLNPVVRIKDQFLDSFPQVEIRARGKRVMLEEMATYLQELELPADVLNAYPHQLSGGMRQRVIVALATFVQPKFVLADEPTTALDVVIQRGILTMLMNLQKKLGNTFVMVSHDMGVHNIPIRKCSSTHCRAWVMTLSGWASAGDHLAFSIRRVAVALPTVVIWPMLAVPKQFRRLWRLRKVTLLLVSNGKRAPKIHSRRGRR